MATKFARTAGSLLDCFHLLRIIPERSDSLRDIVQRLFAVTDSQAPATEVAVTVRLK